MAETKETHDSEPFYTEQNRKEKTSSFQDSDIFFKYSQALKNKLGVSLMKTEMGTRLIPQENLNQNLTRKPQSWHQNYNLGASHSDI